MSGPVTTMQSADLRMFVGGNWIASASGEVMQLKSPSTGKPVATVPRGTREDVSTAVAAAQAAQPRYARLTAFERCKLCHQVADVVRARREALARHLAMEQGKPYHAEALGEVDVAEKMFRMAAEGRGRGRGTRERAGRRRSPPAWRGPRR